jgi:uncharacterized protein (TIGR02271 family)
MKQQEPIRRQETKKDIAKGEKRIAEDKDQVTVPVIEEDLAIGKRQVETGGARVQSRVVEKPIEENVDLRQEHVQVERRPVNRPIQPGDMQLEEGTIEMVERAEEAVVDKRARVAEEVVITKEVDQRTETISDTLRFTEVQVDRLPGRDATLTSDFEGGSATRPFELYDNDFRTYHQSSPGAQLQYESAAPAYRYGYDVATSQYYRGRDWDAIEREARGPWEQKNPGTWEQAKEAVRHAWAKVTGKA